MSAPENSRIEKAFEDYRQHVIPPDASEVQVMECRRAFFSGAAALFRIIMQLDEGDEATPADMALVASLQAEMRTFPLRVLRGEA